MVPQPAIFNAVRRQCGVPGGACGPGEPACHLPPVPRAVFALLAQPGGEFG